MQDSKIGDYFSPISTRSVKRPRPNISPVSPDNTDKLTMGQEDEKVGDMSLAQLMSGLSKLLESKLDEKLSKLATKDDISSLNIKMQELVTENEALRQEICLLKRQWKKAQEKLVDLEARSRRNNLIFKGLQWNGNRPDFREIVRNFCRDVLGCTESLWVNRAHPVGRDGKSIIAHIPEDSDISYILSQTRKLKGTGYIVHRDFPQEIREKRSCLVAVRAEVDRVTGGLKMPLVHDHLYVRGKRFTWEEGKLCAGPLNGVQELNKMFRHDFTDFITGLARRNSDPNSTPQTYAQAASKDHPGTTSQPPEQTTPEQIQMGAPYASGLQDHQ